MADKDKDELNQGGPGAPGAAAAEAEDLGPLTNDRLYPDDDGGEDPGAPGAAKKGKGGEGDGGEDEDGKGGKPKGKTERDRQWDLERQRRDQDHANERKALADQNAALQETTLRLLERLEKAGQPKPDSQAADDLADLSETIRGLTEDSEPTDIIRAMPKILDALKKVRASGGASTELTALRKQVEEQQAALEELRTGQSQSAETRAYEKRKEHFNDFLDAKDKDKDYGPDLRNEAVRIATAEVVDLGYTSENPCSEDVMILALKNAYREARDARTAKKVPARRDGGKPRPAADAGAGGGAAGGGGKPKGRMSNREFLRRFRGK